MARITRSLQRKSSLIRASIFNQKLTEHGLSQKQLAEKLGVSQPYVSQFAYGWANSGKVRKWTIDKFGEDFQTELDSLFPGIEPVEQLFA